MAQGNAATIWKFLRGKGLSPAQTAGVIGVMQQESGQGLSTTAQNPSSGAYGIAQWLGGRKSALMSRPNPTSLNTQLNHLWSELQGPERGALQRLKGAHSIDDAAKAWLMAFERPGANEMVLGRRVANARNVFNQLHGVSGSASATPDDDESSGDRTRTVMTTSPGVDNKLARLSLVQSFLEDRDSDPVGFAVQANALKDIPATTTSKTVRVPGTTRRSDGGGGGGGSSDLASFATARANELDAKRFPYKWGGGHAGKIGDISDAVPVDCSGAVSAVLGINPRVSGQFGKWGRPGDGGNRGVTIYSNGHHVLMKINGHFFGTSRANPGGGAGWIPQSAVSGEYLKGFTVRHSKR